RLPMQCNAQTCKKQEHRNAPQGIEVTHSIKAGACLDAGKPAASCILHFVEGSSDLALKVKRGSFCSRPFIVNLSERQSHWLNSRDLRSEPLFPWFRFQPRAATFRPVDT
ncbi:MAG TPA: hypothetical protein VGJ30_02190, partial [Candidatus Angelobacter sp.]